MKNILSVFLFTLLLSSASAQDCTQTQLSNTFIFTTHLTRIHIEESFDSCIMQVTIYDQSTMTLLQTIAFSSPYFFEPVFRDCNNVRSYSTGMNREADVTDNDYGDLIVADFNFDGKEDIALKKDSGGNGGPIYLFYLQNHTGQFELDTFLTERMKFFPALNVKKRTLTTLVHANAYELCQTTYKLGADNVWIKQKRRFVRY